MRKVMALYKNISVQAKASLWFVICSILQRGISFITVPIFTRLLSAEQYGMYSLFNSWNDILAIITSFYLYCGVFNNAMVKFENDRDRYISSMQGLVTIIWLTVFVSYLVFQDLWYSLIGLIPCVMYMMFAELLVTPALNFWSARQRFEFQYFKLVAVTLGMSIANPVIGLITVTIAEEKGIARIFSCVIVQVVVCGYILIKQYINGQVFFVKKYWDYAIKMAVPLLPHYLSGTILNQGDRVMINKMVGTSEVAFYSVAYNIGILVQIITNAINNSFTPWVYQKIKEKGYHGISKTANILLLFIAAIAFALMLCSPELVQIFGSEQYASAAYVIPPVAASVFFNFLYNIFAIPQFYFEKTSFLLVSSISAAVLNVILNYIFILQFGYVAAGYTTLACYVLYSFGHYLVSKKVITDNLKDVEMFDEKAILIMSLGVITVGVSCNFLFDHPFIRYNIIIVGIVFLYLNKNKLINIVKEIRE